MAAMPQQTTQTTSWSSLLSSQNLAAAGVVGQTMGAVTSVVGSFYAVKAQKKALKAQAELDKINARIMEQMAQGELLAGQRKEQASRLQYAAVKSQQRVGLAAGNIDLGEGSALQIQTSTDLMNEIDANTIQANALAAAWGYRMKGVDYSNSATTNRASASGLSSLTAAGSTFLTGASQVAESYNRYKVATANTPSNG